MSKEKAIEFYKTIKEAFPNDLYKHKELTKAISAFFPDFYKIAEGVTVDAKPKKQEANSGVVVMSMNELYEQTNQKKTSSAMTSPSQQVKEAEVVPLVGSNEPTQLGVLVRKLKGIEYTFDLDDLKTKDLEGWIEYFKSGSDYEQMLAYSIATKMKTLRAKNSGVAGIDLVNDLFVHFQEKYLNAN